MKLRELHLLLGELDDVVVDPAAAAELGQAVVVCPSLPGPAHVLHHQPALQGQGGHRFIQIS